MRDLKNWNEVTRGMYRYAIGADTCYEIVIMHQDEGYDILTANADLYLVGVRTDKKNNLRFFERELLLSGSVTECLEKAVEDYEESIYNEL
jgi:hypothetical protein